MSPFADRSEEELGATETADIFGLSVCPEIAPRGTDGEGVSSPVFDTDNVAEDVWERLVRLAEAESDENAEGGDLARRNCFVFLKLRPVVRPRRIFSAEGLGDGVNSEAPASESTAETPETDRGMRLV